MRLTNSGKVVVLSISLIAIYVLVKFGMSYWYFRHVNYELFLKLKEYSQENYYDSNLLKISNSENKFFSNIGNWGKDFVRLHHGLVEKPDNDGILVGSMDFLVELSSNELDWRIIFNAPCPSNEAYILGDQLLYFCDNIFLINKEGKVDGKVLKSLTINGYKSIQIGKKIYFIENDDRLKWLSLKSFTTGILTGPNLITATELNLDTLEYKEHIIGYDQYWK